MAKPLWRWPLAAVCLTLLLLYGIANCGLLAEDEPRYAAIGREMAASGDWVTPRLWGEAWFEKPALLYWLTGVGFAAGLGPEVAPRLPVALMSAAFLGFFFVVLRRRLGPGAAWHATLVLATSAGWLAYSRVAVTDLPLAASFAAAMLAYWVWLAEDRERWLAAAAAFLGLAVLAKGLVPLVLALPALPFAGKRWHRLLRPAPLAAFFAVAAPWYVLCTWRNGWPFLEEFFLRHHFGRFVSSELQHVQPFWFYVPVLAAGLFPWTPLVALLARRAPQKCRQEPFFWAWLVFGLVFFSASRNKLPGYILPLVPALAVLVGGRLAAVRRAPVLAFGCGLLLGALPVIGEVLPQALRSGLSRVDWTAIPWWGLAAGTGIACLAAAAEWRANRLLSGTVLGISVTAGVVYLAVAALPALDYAVSARSVWREIAPQASRVCLGEVHRRYRYGLAYYAGSPLPDCGDQPRPLVLEAQGSQRPQLTPAVAEK